MRTRLNDTVGKVRQNEMVGQARLNDTVGKVRQNEMVGQARLNDTVGQARLTVGRYGSR